MYNIFSSLLWAALALNCPKPSNLNDRMTHKQVIQNPNYRIFGIFVNFDMCEIARNCLISTKFFMWTYYFFKFIIQMQVNIVNMYIIYYVDTEQIERKSCLILLI